MTNLQFLDFSVIITVNSRLLSSFSLFHSCIGLEAIRLPYKSFQNVDHMSPGHHVPAVEADFEDGEVSVHSKAGDKSRRITSEDGNRDIRMRSSSPRGGGPMPGKFTRRHTDLPHGIRSMRDRSWGSDGEAEDESPRANHARPRSPSSIIRHRTSSGERKCNSSVHDESAATIPTLHSRRRSPAKGEKGPRSPTSHAGTDVLSFLDPDSPNVTEESIKRTLEASTQWHRDPRSTSPRSSAGSSAASTTGTGSPLAHDSQQETEAYTSPETSVNGDIVSTTFVQGLSNAQPPLGRPDAKSTAEAKPAPRRKQAKDKEYHYGTPEMPRGNANLPHLPPNALTPRVQNPGQGHVKHLPRAEKLPLTGYELLAARLSANSGRDTSNARRHRMPQSSQPSSPGSGRSSPDGEPDIKPIYRRFEALNHRLLLHLQDELSELEEQLHRLDTADTQTRRLQNCILPASRRAEYMSGGELQWHKTDILGKIGFKLGQYNHALSSFRESQNLPSPDLADVETYRTYLATDNPIAEIETRFLDPTDDLVSLAPDSRPQHRPRSDSSSSSSSYGNRKGAYSPAALSDEAPTPRQGSLATFLPKTTQFPYIGAPGGTFLPTPSLSPASSVAACSRPSTRAGPDDVERPVATAMAGSAVKLAYILFLVSVLLPVLLFRVMGGFAARVAVVFVSMAVAGVISQVFVAARLPEQPQGPLRLASKDLFTFTGVYGAFVAVLAAVC